MAGDASALDIHIGQGVANRARLACRTYGVSPLCSVLRYAVCMWNVRRELIPNDWDTRREVMAIGLGAFIGAALGTPILRLLFPHANWFVATACAIPFEFAWMVAVIYGFRFYDRRRVRRE
jgi:hypothetical protein